MPRSSLKESRTVRSQVLSAIEARRSWCSPAPTQGAAADDLGGAAGGRLAQRSLAPPRRVDRQADEAAGELPAALPFEHRPGDAGAHAAAHQRARQPVARVAVAAVKEQADGRVGGLGRRSLRAAQRRLAAQQRGERVGLAGPQADLRVGAADIEPAVVVGAGDRADGGRDRLAAVLLGQARDERRATRRRARALIRFSMAVELPLRVSHRAKSSMSCS